MKFQITFKEIALSLATVGMVLPNPSLLLSADRPSAGQNETQKQPISDVSLDANNRLVGQVVDGKGTAQAGALVTVASLQGTSIQKIKADNQGMFSADIKQGGVYQISGKESSATVRVWTQQAAPPAAHPGIMIVDDSQVVNGQLGAGAGGKGLLLIGVGAAVVGGVIGTAVSQNKSS